jgi:hypothetical protein
VKGVKKIGVRIGNWLTAVQSQRLWQAPSGERLKEKSALASQDSWPVLKTEKELNGFSNAIQSCHSEIRKGPPLWGYFHADEGGLFNFPNQKSEIALRVLDCMGQVSDLEKELFRMSCPSMDSQFC